MVEPFGRIEWFNHRKLRCFLDKAAFLVQLLKEP